MRSVAESIDPRIAELAERIAAGESIDPATLAGDLLVLPAAQNLLRFARATAGLSRNAEMEPPRSRMPDRIGPWRLTRLLGSGGMGDVWLGERADGTVQHRVAIKRVRGASRSFTARLEAERRILATLSHPNIARFIDAGVDDGGAPWMALEYIDGETLDAWLERARPSLGTRLELFLAVCAAVEHAHRHLVVHRDLKPANILVDAAGGPHLLDFGVAKLLDEIGSETTLNALTPAYAAPEQLRGETVSTATDVCSLGLVLYRMLAGELPSTRRSRSMLDVLVRLDDEETQRPSVTARSQPLPYLASALAGDLDAIVSTAIRADPASRYGSVAELAADLRRYRESHPVKARVPTRWYRFVRYARRNRLALGLGLFAAMALIGGSTVALWQARVAQSAALAKAQEAERADREAASAKAQAQRAQRSATFVLSVFQQADQLRRDERGVISIDEAFEDALKRIDREFSDDAMVAADLNDNFGEILASKGRFDEAEQRLQKALALAERSHGPDSLAVAETLLNLTVVEGYRGRPLEGKAYIERALAIFTRHPDADPLELANARMTYGNVLSHELQRERARKEIEAGLAIYRKHLPDSDQRLSIAVFNFGGVLYEEGRWAEAQPVLDEALLLTEKQMGQDSAALLPILDYQATNLDNLGRHEDAERTLRKMLAIADAAYSEAHPLRAGPTMELGYHQLRDGRVAEGTATLQRGIAMARTLESPLEIFGWRWLAKGLLRNERWREAQAAARSGESRCVHFKRQSQSRCLDLRLLALMAALGENPRAAVDADIAALVAEIERSRPGGETPSLLLRLRGQVALASGERAKALTDFAAARDALALRYAPTHRDVADADAHIATIRPQP